MLTRTPTFKYSRFKVHRRPYLFNEKYQNFGKCILWPTHRPFVLDSVVNYIRYSYIHGPVPHFTIVHFLSGFIQTSTRTLTTQRCNNKFMAHVNYMARHESSFSCGTKPRSVAACMNRMKYICNSR